MTSMDNEKWTTEQVLSVHYWTPTLLSFRTTRHRGFRFTPGHYARLGLSSSTGEEVWRPYSMVSAAHDEHLEFIAVLVPDGAFSSALRKLKVGDEIKVEKACFGFLTVDQLAPGRDLWLLASGTGLGPMLSILKDPAVWRDFEHLIIAHSVRTSGELAYRDEINSLRQNPLLAAGGAQLTYLPIVTREPGASELDSRLTELISNGRLEKAAGRTLKLTDSRLIICGNPELLRDLRQLLGARGFNTNRRGILGQMAFEKYW